jgi:hypothetical protein
VFSWESVTRTKSSSPFNSTAATGSTAFICQFNRTRLTLDTFASLIVSIINLLRCSPQATYNLGGTPAALVKTKGSELRCGSR